MTDEEPRLVKAHGYTPEELAEVLNKYNQFEIGGQNFNVVHSNTQQLSFTMKLVK